MFGRAGFLTGCLAGRARLWAGNRNTWIRRSCLITLGFSGSWAMGLGADEWAPVAPQDGLQRADLTPGAGREIALEIPRGNPRAFEIDVPLERGVVTIALERAHIFSDDATVTIVGDQVREEDWAPLDLPIYRGTIEGDEGTIVAAHLTQAGGLQMIIAGGDGVTRFVEPNLGARGLGKLRSHVIYSAIDLEPREGSCAVELGEEQDAPEQQVLTGGDRMGSTGDPQILVAELAIDADYEYFQLFGSSTSAVTEDVASLMAMVNVVYERDTGITHRISALIIRTSPNDPYSSTESSALLNEMVSHWRANESSVQRDLAHLFTGKDLDGSIIGRAKVGVVCGSSAYAISQARYTTNVARRVGLIAHELGHNWGADHCTGEAACQIMCSSLGGCDGLGEPGFVNSSASEIAGFADRLSCLGSEVIQCLGDADDNLVVDFRDITAILGTWGQSYGVGTGVGDADGNGVVNFEDLTNVLAHWGDLCS